MVKHVVFFYLSSLKPQMPPHLPGRPAGSRHRDSNLALQNLLDWVSRHAVLDGIYFEYPHCPSFTSIYETYFKVQTKPPPPL